MASGRLFGSCIRVLYDKRAFVMGLLLCAVICVSGRSNTHGGSSEQNPCSKALAGV